MTPEALREMGIQVSDEAWERARADWQRFKRCLMDDGLLFFPGTQVRRQAGANDGNHGEQGGR